MNAPGRERPGRLGVVAGSGARRQPRRQRMFDWITGLVEDGGYLGIATLMLAENLFPPIPSELIMPLAGFAAARGDLNILLVVASGAAGSLLGAVFWYAIGCWLGRERLKRWAGRHGRWLTLAPDDIDKACAWFDRHSAKAVFFGRLVPAVRTLISVPAGIAGMGRRRFLLYRSEEHTSELQSLMRISYAVFCLKNKTH